MRVRNHLLERLLDPIAIRIGDDQRGQELYRVIGVSCYLTEDLVLLQQRDHDELAKQPAARRFEQIPGCL